ncbi:MAG TPA: D-alanine--D-alanine ligase [Eggerthellaceae bacterium]|nr:D-alanine--D-alanine ligase [Eggerthellaceae bacterium]
MAVIPSKCKVALLAGGTSGERSISINSGNGAREALLEAGYDVDWIDPASKEDLKKLIDNTYDVAFLCLHGKMGEDGTVQGMLELLGIPYTCSGIQASAIAMDKAKSKILYENAGIPTAPSMTIERGKEYNRDEIVNKIGVPCVVKPATEGSALGVEIVEEVGELEQTIERVLEIDSLIVIEKFVKGDEITVAILGNDDAYALPVIQIVPKGEFYDFESKYAPGGSEHICPAPMPEEITSVAQEFAIRAHHALGCSGVSRSDFIIDENGKPWILETNTIPGMTATSLLPDAARAGGMTFPELCTALIEYALNKVV